MLGRIKQTDLSVPYAHRRATSITREPKKGSSIPTCAAARAAWTAPEEILLDLNELAEGHKFLGLGALRRQRRRELAGVFDRHDRLPAVHAAGEGSAHRRDPRREDRAGRLGRVGERQQDALLHDRRRSLEALRQVLAAHGRAPTRAICSTKRRTSCSTSAPAGRSTSKMIFVGSYAKTSREYRYLPRRRSVRRAQARARPRAGARVRRRPLQRRVLHHHQPAARRTSASSPRRSPIRPRRTGSRSSITIPASRSTA